jgi:hypothetical protein
VSLVYNESEYNGKVYNWVESVQTIEQFGEADMGESAKRDPYIDPTRRSIEKQVALKAAVDTCITLFAEDKYATPDARIEAVLQAYSAYAGALAQE